jgi:hypothetical protein
LNSDAWIDPLDFSDDDFSKIWMTHSRETNDGIGGGPPFICMTSREAFAKFPGHRHEQNWHYPNLQALAALADANTNYIFNQKEWCTGWSDIYYLPRHLWADFIFLSAFFAAFDAFHEIAIPTMLHIIDQSRRQTPFTSTINWLGECFGGCCNRGAQIPDLFAHRCGHALNYIGDQSVIEAHYRRIDDEAITLGLNTSNPSWKVVPDEQRDLKALLDSLAPAAVAAYSRMAARPVENEYKTSNMPDPIVFNSTGIEPPTAVALSVEESKEQEEEEVQE